MSNNAVNPQLARMVYGNDEIRAKACLNQINDVLKSHDCVLMPSITITGEGIAHSSVGVRPLPRGPVNNG